MIFRDNCFGGCRRFAKVLDYYQIKREEIDE